MASVVPIRGSVNRKVLVALFIAILFAVYENGRGCGDDFTPTSNACSTWQVAASQPFSC